MTERVVHLPAELDPGRIIAVVEAGFVAEGLLLRSKGTTRAYPGSTHWHAVRRGEPGTLEATFWPAGHRLWLKIHPRRNAPWVMPTADRLVESLERTVAGLIG